MKHSLQKSGPKAQWRIAYPAKALAAACLLGALTGWALYPNTWTSQISYQPPNLDQTAPLSLQAAFIQSPAVLGKVSQQLASQGLSSWSPQKLASALRVEVANDTRLLEVTIETPKANEAQQISRTLDTVYRQTLQNMESERLATLHDEVQNELKETQSRLAKGEQSWKAKTGGFAAFSGESGMWAADQTLLSDYQALSQKLRDVQSDLVSAQTHYRHYKGILRQDESALLKSSALNDDPVLQKLNAQLAEAQKDDQIQSVGLTSADASPEATHQARIEYLQREVSKERARVLSPKAPVIRDAVRQGLIRDLIESRAAIESAKQSQKRLQAERSAVLKNLDQAASTLAQADAWTLEKRLLTEERHQLQKQLKTIESQQTKPQSVVKVFEAPSPPLENTHTSEKSKAAATAFAGSFLLLTALPLLVKKVEAHQHATVQSVTSLAQWIQGLTQTPGQNVVLVLPLNSEAHNNTSVHVGGLLNQTGRSSLVVDVDLTQRALSQHLNVATNRGLLQHLLDGTLKAPTHEALTGADILPLETTLTRQQVAEFTQITKRLPKLFARWPQSVVLLDSPRWHEAYRELMPHVSQVVFYGESGQTASSPLPQLLASQYGVPVQILQG